MNEGIDPWGHKLTFLPPLPKTNKCFKKRLTDASLSHRSLPAGPPAAGGGGWRLRTQTPLGLGLGLAPLRSGSRLRALPAPGIGRVSQAGRAAPAPVTHRGPPGNAGGGRGPGTTALPGPAAGAGSWGRSGGRGRTGGPDRTSSPGPSKLRPDARGRGVGGRLRAGVEPPPRRPTRPRAPGGGAVPRLHLRPRPHGAPAGRCRRSGRKTQRKPEKTRKRLPAGPPRRGAHAEPLRRRPVR